jgi:hypothetical protein
MTPSWPQASYEKAACGILKDGWLYVVFVVGKANQTATFLAST